MAKRTHGRVSDRKQKLKEAREILSALGFASKQCNDTAAYAFLALADLKPPETWAAAKSPLRGITPIIEFINDAYGVQYAPNTPETIRDDAVKYFVDSGLLIRNPDKPDRPPNSGNTVYQFEPSALALIRSYGTDVWSQQLDDYLSNLKSIRADLERNRDIPRIPVHLPDGSDVTISPGGQNPLIKSVVEEFCPRFAPGALVVYIGDAENKFLHLDAPYLQGIGVVLAAAAKMPDVIVHDVSRNWLLLIEAVVTTGTVDAKRRKELKELFANCSASLVFVTAFQDRQSFTKFQPQIAWETEVWCAAEPDHMIHYNGERFLGPYPDVLPNKE